MYLSQLGVSLKCFYNSLGWQTLFLANHPGIAKEAGILNVMEYRYFNPVNKGLDIEGMLEDLSVSIIYSYFNVIHLPSQDNIH